MQVSVRHRTYRPGIRWAGGVRVPGRVRYRT